MLQSLELRLRRKRRVWELAFASSGAAALELCAQHDFDVVVTDMRMPVMDGVALLTRIRDEYPRMFRVMLTGHVGAESLMAAVRVVHRFLDKPCDPATLDAVVARGLELQALLNSDVARRIVGSVESIPSIPKLYWELATAIDDPGVSLQDVGRLIEGDIGMHARVLQIVNSSYFGFSRQIRSAAEAVPYLGIEAIRQLMLTTFVFSAYQNHKSASREVSLEPLVAHSMATAKISAYIVGKDAAQDALTAGMLHDVGAIVLATRAPKAYARAQQHAAAEAISMSEAEHRVFGVTHGGVGAYLLGLWGLERSVVEAVAYHEAPQELGDEPSLASAIYIANALSNDRIPEARPSLAFSGNDSKDAAVALDETYVARLGVADRMADWRAYACKLTMAGGAATG